MQHKSLLAALMVGVLALASCVKNEESQSVTDMRNARADEIKSQAELNRANAQAAITLAQAQATIAAAQAELLEAQAAIAAAQAAKIMVEAELQAVEVEIAKVKLEEEKVKLQAKKAELEALIAKYEAEIAKYNADKQEALNRLAAAEAQAEIDEIKAEVELLKQEKNLFDAIAALETAKQDEIARVWRKYYAEVTALNTAQTKLINAQVELAKLEAGEETAEDILLDQIYDKQAEIIAKQMYIAELESHVNMSAKELDAVIAMARAAFADAKSEELEATLAQNAIQEKLNKKLAAQYSYQTGWSDDDGFVTWLNGLADIYHDYVIETEDEFGDELYNYVFYRAWKENEVGQWENGIYYYYPSSDEWNDARNWVFVPLFTEPIWFTKYGDTEVYPSSEDGVVPGPGNKIAYRQATYFPAKIYFDNFAELIDLVQGYEEEAAIAQRKAKRASALEAIGYIQQQMSDLATAMEAHTEYLTKAFEEVGPAGDAWDAAEAEYYAAMEDFYTARDNYLYYLNSHDGDIDAAKDEAEALNAYIDAVELQKAAKVAYDKAYEILYGTAPEATANTDGDGEGAQEGLINKVPRLEDVSYKAGLEAAKKYDAMIQAGKKATAELKQAWDDAQDALDAKELEIADKEAEQEQLLIAYHKQDIIYAAEPTDANKDLRDEAKTAWEKAGEELAALQEEVPALQQKVTEAKTAWDAVNDPYQQAIKDYNEAQEIADKAYQDWQEAKEELEGAEGALVAFAIAEGALDAANDAVEKAAKDLEKAQKLNPDQSEEYKAVLAAWDTAYKAMYAAYNVMNEAEAAYYALVDGPDAKYPKFIEYYYNITEGYGDMFGEDREYVPGYGYYWAPGQELSLYNWFADKLEFLTNFYNDYFAQDPLSKSREKYSKLRAKLAEYAAEEETYLEHIAEMQAMSDAIIEAEKMEIDAKNALAKAEAAYNALVTLKNDIQFSTDGTDAVDIEAYEAKIKEEKEALKKLEEEYTALITELYFGKPDEEGNYPAAKKAELENNIMKYQNAIEYHTMMIEYYLGVLTELLGEDGGIE